MSGKGKLGSPVALPVIARPIGCFVDIFRLRFIERTAAVALCRAFRHVTDFRARFWSRSAVGSSPELKGSSLALDLANRRLPDFEPNQLVQPVRCTQNSLVYFGKTYVCVWKKKKLARFSHHFYGAYQLGKINLARQPLARLIPNFSDSMPHSDSDTVRAVHQQTDCSLAWHGYC